MGKLVIVGTPLGNISDMSMRGMAAILTAKFIAAEDTRRAGNLRQLLWQSYKDILPDLPSELVKPTYISYRDQNHNFASSKIIELIESGEDILLTTDSGMPAISDPGYKLIRAVRDAALEVDVIPGPTALTTALSFAGLPTDRFIFLGFPPKSVKQQGDLFDRFGNLEATLVLYESPIRVSSTLANVLTTLGDREVSVVVELTKLHQRSYQGRVLKVIDELKTLGTIRGECVILIRKD